MKLQLIYSTDKQKLDSIHKLVKIYIPDITTADQFFENIVPKWNPNQPVFVVGINQNEILLNKISSPINCVYQGFKGVVLLLFSCVTQYRFSWGLGQRIYLDNIFAHPRLTSEMIERFVEDLKILCAENKNITIVFDTESYRPIKTQSYPTISEESILIKRSLGSKYNKNYLADMNAQLSTFYFKYVDESDYHRQFFPLLEGTFNSPEVSFEEFKKHFQKMKQSNTQHIHVCAIDKKNDKILGQISILIYETIYGKQAIGGNIVILPHLRSFKCYQMLNNVAVNQIQRFPNLKIRFFTSNCQQYTSLGYVQENKYRGYWQPGCYLRVPEQVSINSRL